MHLTELPGGQAFEQLAQGQAQGELAGGGAQVGVAAVGFEQQHLGQGQFHEAVLLAHENAVGQHRALGLRAGAVVGQQALGAGKVLQGQLDAVAEQRPVVGLAQKRKRPHLPGAGKGRAIGKCRDEDERHPAAGYQGRRGFDAIARAVQVHVE